MFTLLLLVNYEQKLTLEIVDAVLVSTISCTE